MAYTHTLLDPSQELCLCRLEPDKSQATSTLGQKEDIGNNMMKHVTSRLNRCLKDSSDLRICRQNFRKRRGMIHSINATLGYIPKDHIGRQLSSRIDKTTSTKVNSKVMLCQQVITNNGIRN